MAKQSYLEFNAVVQSGEGRFSRMVFPGRSSVDNAPEDWPETVQRGSLNCKVTNFPAEFAAVAGRGDRIAALDKGRFEPEFAIPRDQIKNNGLAPMGIFDNKKKGNAQAWRCQVMNLETGEVFDAWHVRRIDGSYPKFHDTIELMADRKLRDAHQLKDGTKIKIKMFRKGQGPS